VLADEHGAGSAMVYLAELPDQRADPIEAYSVLKLVGPMMPERNLVVLRSRWAAWFPAAERHCFVILPFREELTPTWAAIQQASAGTEVPCSAVTWRRAKRSSAAFGRKAGVAHSVEGDRGAAGQAHPVAGKTPLPPVSGQRRPPSCADSLLRRRVVWA
jgi:hypothetical protein